MHATHEGSPIPRYFGPSTPVILFLGILAGGMAIGNPLLVWAASGGLAGFSLSGSV